MILRSDLSAKRVPWLQGKGADDTFRAEAGIECALLLAVEPGAATWLCFPLDAGDVHAPILPLKLRFTKSDHHPLI